MADFLSRYEAGEHVQVWKDLRGLGARVREAAHLDVAWSVAEATMRRVRANVERLVTCLREQRYRFADVLVTPYAPPDADAKALALWLEARFGPLPLSLRAWIEIVGDVNLMGTHPSWQGDAYGDWRPILTDPLVMEVAGRTCRRDDARAVFEADYANWKQERAEGLAPKRFHLAVAPDEQFKANCSGGDPYGVPVPDPAADALIDCAGDRTYFVDYLRDCFAWGGFPGFEGLPDGTDGGTLAELRKALEPF